MERRIGRILAGVARAEGAITFAAFCLLILILFSDVVMREVTGTGLIWARQGGVYANLFLTLVGIGIASARGAHLRPRFADAWLPASWDPVLSRLQEALLAVFCVAFALIAAAAVTETRFLGERTAMPAWPVWPFQLVIPAVFLVASLRHAAYALYPALGPGRTAGGSLDDGGER